MFSTPAKWFIKYSSHIKERENLSCSGNHIFPYCYIIDEPGRFIWNCMEPSLINITWETLKAYFWDPHPQKTASEFQSRDQKLWTCFLFLGYFFGGSMLGNQCYMPIALLYSLSVINIYWNNVANYQNLTTPKIGIDYMSIIFQFENHFLKQGSFLFHCFGQEELSCLFFLYFFKFFI